jgi:alkanesulfonate monooxygenase SsuD/methylene tetrahydromethanopterin reductase-like flavin-dependent oxidoreductase (luciferase family)
MDMYVPNPTTETTSQPAASSTEQLFNHMAEAFADAIADHIVKKLLGQPKYSQQLLDFTRNQLDREVQAMVNTKFEELDSDDQIEEQIRDWMRNYFDISDYFEISDYEDEIKSMVEVDEHDIREAIKGSEFYITFAS